MPSKARTPRQGTDRRDSEDRKAIERRLREGLRGTFPASDAVEESEPGGGITSLEPPPKGQKNGL